MAREALCGTTFGGGGLRNYGAGPGEHTRAERNSQFAAIDQLPPPVCAPIMLFYAKGSRPATQYRPDLSITRRFRSGARCRITIGLTGAKRGAKRRC